MTTNEPLFLAYHLGVLLPPLLWQYSPKADSYKGTNIDLADDNGNNVGALGAKKEANGVELIVEAV